MNIRSVQQARGLIGTRMFWNDESERWKFIRSGILTSTYRNHLEFDNSQDFKPIKSLKKLRTTEEEESA